MEAHVRDILTLAMDHPEGGRAVVVADAQSGLARLLAAAYRVCLPQAQHIDFDAVPPQAVLDAFAPLQRGDLVVLIQSSSFRLDAFRIRVELFKRGLKVIEHPHLGRMLEDEYAVYADALAYDPGYYRVVGPALKTLLDHANHVTVDSGNELLVYDSTFEPAKLNVGDYSSMTNVGGQFPIGEVFTEPMDLAKVNGRVRIFVFGDANFEVNVPPQPITLVVEGGKVVAAENSTAAFDAVLAQIRAEEDVWVRELGLGMNRAMTPDRTVRDIGTYERMCGIHLSLGAKHGAYSKPGIKRKEGRYHVDVFAVTVDVRVNGKAIFREGTWQV